jgi:hypothetical protein
LAIFTHQRARAGTHSELAARQPAEWREKHQLEHTCKDGDPLIPDTVDEDKLAQVLLLRRYEAVAAAE